MSHHKILGARSVTGIKFNNQLSPKKKKKKKKKKEKINKKLKKIKKNW